MNKENQNDKPVSVPFEDANAYLAWFSEKQNISLQLPTMEQLLVAIELGHIVPDQSLWTREGYIYNPSTKKFATKPGKNMTAGFTFVHETPTSED